MACELLILRHGKSDWSTDHPDFERPQFYKDMFKAWGLDSE